MAFHPYPQVIRTFFNIYRFGPPLRYYRSFNLPMGRSPGFASTPTNLIALFRLAFAAPPYLKYLSLLVRSNS
nr:hypothetical protein [uncultured bacterium]